MRTGLVILVAVGLSACGGSRGVGGHARLNRNHYTLGPQVSVHPSMGADRYDALVVLPPAHDLVEARVFTTAAEPWHPELVPSHPAPVPIVRPRIVPDLPGPVIEPPVFDQQEPPERPRWNPFALASPLLFIAALALAIPLQSTELLLIGCAIAFVAALIGARQCRDRGERGQGFAMAVIGFAVAGVLLAAIALLGRVGG